MEICHGCATAGEHIWDILNNKNAKECRYKRIRFGRFMDFIGTAFRENYTIKNNLSGENLRKRLLIPTCAFCDGLTYDRNDPGVSIVCCRDRAACDCCTLLCRNQGREILRPPLADFIVNKSIYKIKLHLRNFTI